MAVKTAVTVGFLKNHIARVLLIGKNGVHSTRTPFAIFLGLKSSGIQFLGYGVRTFARKAGCENLFYNFCLFRHNDHRAVIVVITVGRIGDNEGAVLKAFLHRPLAVFGNRNRFAFCKTA